MKIKAYVDYKDENKTHYYQNFEVVDTLPKIEKELAKNENYKWYQDVVMNILPVSLDCEQANDEVYDYDFYEVEYFDNIDFFNGYDDSDCLRNEYICVKRNEEC